jgi:hypothetical protein
VLAVARPTRQEEQVSERTHTSRRPRAAVIAGLGIVAALMASACGGSGGGSSSTGTSTPAAVSSPATQVTTTSTSTATTASEGGLSGKWKGTYSGTYSGTFVLDWNQAGSRLQGTIDLSTAGTVPVNGTVDGSAIRFGTVGGSAVHYTGSVSGGSMSGSYRTAGGDGSWTAHRA